MPSILERSPTGDFFPEFDEDRHVVTDLYPPHWWVRFRAYDWGVSDPAVCCWIAISDGQPFKDGEGRERWFPRGALLYYSEVPKDLINDVNNNATAA